MLFEDLFFRYLSFARKYRAPGTAKYYEKNFKLLSRALEACGYHETEDIDDMMNENVTDWMIRETDKKHSKINDAMSCLSTALKRERIASPYFQKLKDDTEPFIELSDDELRLLLGYVKALDSNVSNNLSWKLAVLLFLDTGVRLSEILDIEFRKVDFENHMILLSHTKNGKKRYAFFGALSEGILKEARSRKTEYVLWNYLQNTRLNKRSLEHFFDKVNRDLDLEDRIHPHRLRKTFAMGMLMRGCPVTTISVLLGHSDIRQTMNYLRIGSIMARQDYIDHYPY
jgi:site-specific recombinase XerD